MLSMIIHFYKYLIKIKKTIFTHNIELYNNPILTSLTLSKIHL